MLWQSPGCISFPGGLRQPGTENASYRPPVRTEFEYTVGPIWNGGNITLHIDDASKVFPITCCYLIELTGWKRNIVNCVVDSLTYYNQAHYSFTVTV
jgi:hypothetical protein